MAFGQHQTFYLRQQWLSKGIKELIENSRFFYEVDHFEKLGVGKNMAKSIRHWLVATGIVNEMRKTRVEHEITLFGEIIWKYDRFMQDPVTLSLLHYHLVTDENNATAWYWYHNLHSERVFSKQSLMEELTKWVKENYPREVSANSIKRDIDCLIQLYVKKDYVKLTPEDVIKSPLEDLSLLKQTTATNYIKNEIYHDKMVELLYLTLLLYAEKHGIKEISLNELVNGAELIGKTYNLSRVSVVEYIEELTNKYPVKFIQTNRLDVIRIEASNTFAEALQQYYERSEVHA